MKNLKNTLSKETLNRIEKFDITKMFVTDEILFIENNEAIGEDWAFFLLIELFGKNTSKGVNFKTNF